MDSRTRHHPSDLNDLSDAELTRLARRDTAAFEVLMRRHLPRVHALAASMVGAGAADDVVQDVLVSVHRALGSFRGEAQFSTWLHRITLNACYKALRGTPTFALDDVPEPTAPHDPMVAGEIAALRETLARAMNRLPPDQREAVALRELAALDYAEIAELLGIELGTVKSRIARGRAALKAMLVKEGVRP